MLGVVCVPGSRKGQLAVGVADVAGGLEIEVAMIDLPKVRPN